MPAAAAAAACPTYLLLQGSKRLLRLLLLLATARSSTQPRELPLPPQFCRTAGESASLLGERPRSSQREVALYVALLHCLCLCLCLSGPPKILIWRASSVVSGSESGSDVLGNSRVVCERD
jgi:hypothetical protein